MALKKKRLKKKNILQKTDLYQPVDDDQFFHIYSYLHI